MGKLINKGFMQPILASVPGKMSKAQRAHPTSGTSLETVVRGVAPIDMGKRFPFEARLAVNCFLSCYIPNYRVDRVVVSFMLLPASSGIRPGARCERRIHNSGGSEQAWVE